MTRTVRIGVGLGVATLAALGAVAALVRAEPIAMVDGQPVGVTADHLVIDLNKASALMKGNVRVQRGDLVLRCDQVDARYDEAPNVTWAKATGNVVAEWKGVHARAPEAELHWRRRVLQLRGGVKIARGGAWVQATEATIDFGSGKVTLEKVSGSIPVPSSLPAGGPSARTSDASP